MKLRFEYKITFLYLIIGLLWIFFSDKVLNIAAIDKDLQTQISIFKGFFYVGITALLLFYLIRRNNNKLMEVQNNVSKSEKKFRDLFEQHTAIKLLINPADGSIVDANNSAVNFYGYSKDQLLDMKISDINILSPEQVKLEMEKAKENKQIFFEFKHRKADGTIVDVEVFSSKVIIDGNEYLHSIVHDVTEKKKFFNELLRAKELALESEQKLKEAQSFAKMGSWELDIKTMMFTFNDNFYSIFHTTAEEMGGYQMSITDYASKFVHPDDAELVEIESKKAIEADDPNFSTYLEHKILYQDGGEGYIAVRYKVVKDKNGRTIKTYGVNQDITERKKAEEEKLHFSKLMQYIISNTKSSVSVFDINMNYIYVSDRYFDDLHLSDRNIIGRNHYEVFPELPQFLRDVHQRSLHGETISKNEDILIHPDGSKDWANWSSMPWYNTDGSIGGIVIYIEVITERMKAEEELQIKNMAIESSINAMAIADLKGNLTYVNNSFLSLWGYQDRNEVLGRASSDFLKNAAEPLAVIQALQNQGYWKGEMEALRADGSIIFVEVSASMIQDSRGVPLCLQASFIDVTERKIAQDALLKEKMRAENSEKELIASQKVARVGYYILDVPQDKWTNSEMLDELFGIDEEFERSVEGWINIVHPDDRQMMLDYFINEVIGNKQKFDKQYRIINQKDKQVYWVHGLGSLEFDENGNPIKMFGTIQDITTLKQYEFFLIEAKEKAEESDNLKTAFLQNISHEIRTPLNGILGFSSLLEDEDNTYDDIKEYTSIIKKSGNRLLEIVNNILDISRIETGQIKVEKTTFSINNAIIDLIGFFDVEARSKGIQLKYDFALNDDNSLITTDYHKFFQILTNLVKNAIKFTSEGSIKVGYELRGADYLFFVNDTGSGIPKEVGEKIFERFVQADHSLTRGYEGAGLGLAISKGLVEILGGRIWYESVVGLGTTFYFTLPNNNQENFVELIEEENITVIDDKINILVAEDDENSYLFLSTILKSDNHNIIHSKTGPQALEVFKQNPNIDLIFMDIQLLGMNGYEVTKKIREISKDVIIIAQTAYAHPDDRQKALNIGCDEYISKPYRREEIKKLVSELLNKRTNKQDE